MEIDKIMNLFKEKEDLEQKLKFNRDAITELGNHLTERDILEHSYDEVKELYNKIEFYINEETKDIISAIMKNKKTQKYPQACKPTYYPEIDTLNIPNEDKLRLDEAARNLIRYIIKESNIKKMPYKISMDELGLLASIGVAEKFYDFRCADCGAHCILLAEHDLAKFKKTWELGNLKDKTKEQIEELEDSYENGYFSISLSCMDCSDYNDFTAEISNNEQLEAYMEHIEVSYKIIKVPDLTYEKL